MRLTRRNLILVALVLGLLGADLALRGPAREVAGGGRLLPGLEPDDVARIRLQQGEAQLDLERTQDGWAVVPMERFPAHTALVRELLARLAGVSKTDLVSSTAGARATYGLGDGATRVELFDGGGVALAALWVGHPPELAQGAYVRLEGEDSVYRAATLPAIDTDPLRWLDTLLVDLDPTRVQSIRLEVDGAEAFQLTRLSDGRWRAVGQTSLLTAQSVDPLLLVASNLYFVDLASETPGLLDAARMRIVFDLEQGGRREVCLGGEDAEGNLPATNAFWAQPWVVLLSNSTAVRLGLAVERVVAELE